MVGGGANGSWSRALDASVSADFVDGKTVAVGEGNTLNDSFWQLTTNAPIVLGVSNVVFIEQAPPALITGWTRDAGPPAAVSLTTATDQVAIGTAAGAVGRKVTVTTTGANQGLRTVGLAATDNALDAGVAGEANLRLSVDVAGLFQWGPGGAGALDMRVQRSGVGALTLDTPTGTPALLSILGTASVVLDDAVNAGISTLLTLGHTTSGVPTPGIGVAVLLQAEGTGGVRDAGGVTAILTAVGAGVEASALGLWTRTGGAALAERWRIEGAGALVPLVAGTVFGSLAARPDVIHRGINAVGRSVVAVGVDAITAADAYLDYNATAGNQTPTLPDLATNRGMVVKIKRLQTAASANTCIVTPAGVNTIDGLATWPLVAGAAIELYAPAAGTAWLVH